MNRVIIALTGLILFAACNIDVEVKNDKTKTTNDSEVFQEDLTLEAIIDSVYHKYGSERVNTMSIHFDFRDFQYAYEQDKAGLKRSRKFTNDKGEKIYDVWQGNTLTTQNIPACHKYQPQNAI